jgi:ankyrin repeat protein
MYGRLQEQRHAERGVHLDFFFSARGTEMQRAPLGMLRSLMNQLFHQDPSVRPPVRELYEDRCAAFGRGGHDWEWQRRELEDLLTSAIKTSAQQQQMTIFIDALDEAGEESAQEIAGYFHRVLEAIVSVSANARICISCRHYPIASTVHGVEVVVEEHNGDDIIAFLDDPLNLDCPRPNDTRDLEQWHGLRTDLVRRAAGVFQWVRLIVPLVQKHINNCEPPEYVRQWLHRVPKELEAVYEHIIRNVIDCEHRSQSYKLFQWVCFAEQPLSVTEIRYALGAEGAGPSSPRVKCCDTSDFVKTDEQMKGRLKALSGGLVEAVEERVQVIHQSLNEFLLPKGLALLASLQIEGPAINPADNKAAIVGQCQATLYWSCLNYLATELDEDSCLQKEIQDYYFARTDQLRESLSHLPLMRYATIHVLVHGEKATVYRGDLSGQIRLLEQIIPHWIGVYKIFDPYPWKSPPGHTTILHVAARANLTDIVERLMGHSPDVGNRHRRTWKLRRERTRKIMKPDIRDNKGYTALHVAAQWGHQSVIEILFHAGASIHVLTTEGETPLVIAAGNGHLRVLQWLLRQGANVNDARGSSGNALAAAAQHGEVMIVKFLLDHGADVNAQGGKYGNALQAASYNNQKKIVQMLLEREADVNAQEDEHGNALRAASSCGHEKIVQMLLKRGADVNAPGGRYDNALQAASFGGYEKIVQMLLERGVDANAQGGRFGNALQAASRYGYEKIVQMLLKRGADVNAQGGYFGNALQAASFAGHEKIVQMLLEREIDVNAQGGRFGNALQAASFDGHEKIVQMLLEREVGVNAQGGFYGNALQAASYRGREKIVQMLLERGVDVNAQGGEFDNALQAASRYGHERVKQLLINAGAKVELEESSRKKKRR